MAARNIQPLESGGFVQNSTTASGSKITLMLTAIHQVNTSASSARFMRKFQEACANADIITSAIVAPVIHGRITVNGRIKSADSGCVPLSVWPVSVGM